LSTEYDSTDAIIPSKGVAGGNYVDLTLKVIGLMDVDTVLVLSISIKYHISFC
jgi:hypothetical protein